MFIRDVVENIVAPRPGSTVCWSLYAVLMDGEPKNNPKPDLEEASQWLNDSPLDRRAVNRNIHSSISGAGSTGVQIHIMMNKLVKKWGGPDRSVPKSVVSIANLQHGREVTLGSLQK